MVVPSPVFQHVPNSFGCERCYHCLQSCGSCHHSGSKSKSGDVAGRRGRKAWSEDVAGRRGRKTWPEGVVGRRGRKAWPEGVVGKLALGFEPVGLSLAVPWCAKSQNFKMLHSPRCRLDALKTFPDSSEFLSAFESNTLVKQDSQPLAKLLEAHSFCCVWSFRRSETRKSLKSSPTVFCQRVRSGTPATVIMPIFNCTMTGG